MAWPRSMAPCGPGGGNDWGQLGDGSTELRTTAVKVDLPADVVAAEAATNTVHAIRADGTVLAWGHNPHGQLGDGTTRASSVPVAVKNLTDVTSIAAGDFVLAVRSDGTVWALGAQRSVPARQRDDYVLPNAGAGARPS